MDVSRDQIMKGLECQVTMCRAMGNQERILSKGRTWSDTDSRELIPATQEAGREASAWPSTH